MYALYPAMEEVFAYRQEEHTLVPFDYLLHLSFIAEHRCVYYKLYLANHLFLHFHPAETNKKSPLQYLYTAISAQLILNPVYKAIVV